MKIIVSYLRSLFSHFRICNNALSTPSLFCLVLSNLCVYVCVCVCACVYIHIYIYIYTHWIKAHLPMHLFKTNATHLLSISFAQLRKQSVVIQWRLKTPQLWNGFLICTDIYRTRPYFICHKINVCFRLFANSMFFFNRLLSLRSVE